MVGRIDRFKKVTLTLRFNNNNPILVYPKPNLNDRYNAHHSTFGSRLTVHKLLRAPWSKNQTTPPSQHYKNSKQSLTCSLLYNRHLHAASFTIALNVSRSSFHNTPLSPPQSTEAARGQLYLEGGEI